MFSKTAIAAGLATYASAAVSLGSCPDFKGMANFEPEKYMGRWYGISKDVTNFYELIGSCNVADYTLNDDRTVEVHNWGSKLLKTDDIIGKAAIVDSKDATLDVQFFSEPSASADGNYTVLYTDYETYTVVYDCRYLLNGLVAYQIVDVLARTPTLPDSKMIEIVEKIEELVPSYSWFHWMRPVRQELGCNYDNYLPVPPQPEF